MLRCTGWTAPSTARARRIASSPWRSPARRSWPSRRGGWADCRSIGGAERRRGRSPTRGTTPAWPPSSPRGSCWAAGSWPAVRSSRQAGAAVRRSLAAGPLLFAAPLGRDLWAYAAQGHLTGRGLDPYTSSPADVPGRFSVEVSSRWMHSSAPYGPLWLRISQFAAWVSRDHPLVAALLLRLPAFAGLLLCCWAVPVLAERLAGRAAARPVADGQPADGRARRRRRPQRPADARAGAGRARRRVRPRAAARWRSAPRSPASPS